MKHNGFLGLHCYFLIFLLTGYPRNLGFPSSTCPPAHELVLPTELYHKFW